jgi:serine phosphatase RsbU (regulator of sigma subunit)
LLDAGIKLQNYTAQLSILHQIGISLNRETNQRKLLEMVLKGAVELTSAGVGILWLITEEQTDVVSLYYPPWFQERCQIEQPVKFHQAISQLVEKKEKDVVRFTNLSDLPTPPPGHLQLQGLMIATVRDLRGNIRGHFMLSNKHEGPDFTLEDEEIISLLAAQCSVALTSAENFEREHYVAESHQTAILPEKPSRDDVEVGLLYRSAAPFAKVGGDFYDFVELDKNRIAVTVGDVCGKGLEAATYTAMIKYMLRAYLGENMLPGDCLTRLNRAVYKQISAEKFITMSLAIIDTERGIVNYSSSGHPPPFICKKGKANPLPTRPAVPLGVLPNHPFLSSQISLAGVCAIFMYTDGLIEARPPEGEPFGEKRLSETVAGYCCLPAQQVADKIAQAALEYSGGMLRDDIAILVVRLLKPRF